MEKIKSYFTIEGWKRDWKKTKSHVQTFGRFLYDILDSGSTARFNEWKQGILDLMDSIEQKAQSPEYKDLGKLIQVEASRRTRERHFLAMGRPDLAYPHIYTTSPIQFLETKLNDINSLYR